MKYYLPQHIEQIQALKAVRQKYNQVDGMEMIDLFFSQKAIQFYFIALVVSNALFFQRFLSPLFWLSGIVSVICFFFYSKKLYARWNKYSVTKFQKKLFFTALIVRVLWVVISYYFYQYMTGQPFEWASADAFGYHTEAVWLADLIHDNKLQTYYDYIQGRYSDMGYAYYLGWQYFFTAKSIIVARLLKAVYGAITCLLIYRIAKRNFGEGVGRLAGIFVMLMPNSILYAGLHLKEVEMVLLTTFFMDQADQLIRNRVFKFKAIILPLLAAISLFFFRTVLGVAAVSSLVIALLMTSTGVLSMGKRIVLLIWILLAGSYFLGGRIATEVESVWAARQDNQKISMEMRATRTNANVFARYAGAAVFAPMIYVLPFPTVISSPAQENQQFINGGNFIKNILAFFVIWGIFVMIKERKWQEHLLLISFVTGYLLILAFSAFAQAERFHQPVLPFELLLAAYGISRIERKHRKYVQWWLVFLVVVVVAWSWFKLAGRGMA